MTLDEGATHEINSISTGQRNVARYPELEGEQYCSNMVAGIQIVRDRYDELGTNAATNNWVDN